VKLEAFDGRQSVPVEIDFGSGAAPPKRADEERGIPTTPAAPEPGSIVPGAVLLGLSGGALIAGAITGGLALAGASDIEKRCGGDVDRCPAALRGEVDPDVESARTMGNVSTGMFVAAGALIATGIVLVIVRPGGATTTANGASTWLAPSPGGFVWAGRF
jgi:hypothetical protein